MDPGIEAVIYAFGFTAVALLLVAIGIRIKDLVRRRREDRPPPPAVLPDLLAGVQRMMSRQRVAQMPARGTTGLTFIDPRHPHAHTVTGSTIAVPAGVTMTLGGSETSVSINPFEHELANEQNRLRYRYYLQHASERSFLP